MPEVIIQSFIRHPPDPAVINLRHHRGKIKLRWTKKKKKNSFDAIQYFVGIQMDSLNIFCGNENFANVNEIAVHNSYSNSKVNIYVHRLDKLLREPRQMSFAYYVSL